MDPGSEGRAGPDQTLFLESQLIFPDCNCLTVGVITLRGLQEGVGEGAGGREAGKGEEKKKEKNHSQWSATELGMKLGIGFRGDEIE